jgi:hypothetical protein
MNEKARAMVEDGAGVAVLLRKLLADQLSLHTFHQDHPLNRGPQELKEVPQ